MNFCPSIQTPHSTYAMLRAMLQISVRSFGSSLAVGDRPTWSLTKSTYLAVAFSVGGAHTEISFFSVSIRGLVSLKPVIWLRISLRAARIPYSIEINSSNAGSDWTGRSPLHDEPLRILRGLLFLIPRGYFFPVISISYQF